MPAIGMLFDSRSVHFSETSMKRICCLFLSISFVLSAKQGSCEYHFFVFGVNRQKNYTHYNYYLTKRPQHLAGFSMYEISKKCHKNKIP